MSVSPPTAPATPDAAKPAAPVQTPAVSGATAARPAVAAPRPTPPKPGVSAKPAVPRPATPRPAPALTAASAPARPAPAPAKPASPWAELFRDWPAGVPQRGIILSQQGETTPFRGFMLRGEMILLERISPDSLGARFLLLPFEEVAGVKFTDPLKQEVFDAAGFTGKLDS